LTYQNLPVPEVNGRSIHQVFVLIVTLPHLITIFSSHTLTVHTELKRDLQLGPASSFRILCDTNNTVTPVPKGAYLLSEAQFMYLLFLRALPAV